MIITNLSKISKGYFKNAYRDFKHLKDLGYPSAGSLKLVGDRYALSRGTAKERIGKLVRPEEVRGAALGGDWYNVLITLDSPVPHSGLMAEGLRLALGRSGTAHTIKLEHSADFAL